jgi:hypothetical protein
MFNQWNTPMPVLLLARGDQESKALLRRAIEARYGLGPPALETLKLQLKGRARAKVGPITTWIPLEITVYLKFAFAVRWDFNAHPVGIPISSGAEAFDGETYRRRHSHDPISVLNTAEEIASMRARLWAMSALLLTPLGEHFVELKAVGERCFDATHRDLGLTTRLQLKPDDTLDFVETRCLNPATGTMQTFSVYALNGQQTVGNLILPRRMGIAWDKQPEVEFSATAANTNLAVDDSVFRLEN